MREGDHLDPRRLRLCYGRLPEEWREILLHLLTCPRCGELLAGRPEEARPGLVRRRPADYGTALQNATASTNAMLRERSPLAREAEALVGELLAVEASERAELLSERHETLEVVVALVDKAEAEWPGDVELSTSLALLAWETAIRVQEREGASSVLDDAMVRALALEGYGLTLQGLPEAQQRFRLASELVGTSQAGTLAEAFLCRVLARAYHTQERFPEAAACAERAAAIYGSLGQIEEDAAELLYQAAVEARLNRVSAALDVLRGVLLLGEEGSPGLAPLARIARQWLAWLFVLCQEYGTAQQVLAAAPLIDEGAYELIFLSLLRKISAEPEQAGEVLWSELKAARDRADVLSVVVACLVLLSLPAERRTGLEPLGRELAWCLRSAMAPPQRSAFRRLCEAIKQESLTTWDLFSAAQTLGVSPEREPTDATVTH